jgi:cytochrome oxidase Cu insertion factor (SCO1/SenC/PrrC family)
VKRLEETFSRAQPKVIWIGFQDKKEKIKEFMLKHDVHKGVGFDEGNVVARKYGIRYGAGLVIIDADGIARARVPKGFSEKKLHEAVNKVITAEGNEKGKSPE